MPADVDIEATVHVYNNDEHQVDPVILRNLTIQTVPIASRGILCEIQTLGVIDKCQKSEKTSTALEKIFSKIHHYSDISIEILQIKK